MIGIFDSGLGGLAAARRIADSLPALDLLYFGDTARGPYGSRSPERITACMEEGLRFMVSRGVRLIIIACHSSAAHLAAFPPEMEGVPILEIISPAVRHALTISRRRRIGVLASRATLTSGIFERRIREIAPDAKVYGNPCPLFPHLVEERQAHKPEGRKILKKCLLPLKVRQIDTLILAGNHFSRMKAVVQVVAGKRIQVVDPAEILATYLKDYLKEKPDIEERIARNGKRHFMVSDITAHMQAVARMIFNGNLALQAAQ